MPWAKPLENAAGGALAVAVVVVVREEEEREGGRVVGFSPALKVATR